MKRINGEISKDINSLIPEGIYMMDIMDNIQMSPRRKELTMKFMEAMEANKSWFLEQQKNALETGHGIEYDSRLGMTEDEWFEYLSLTESTEDMIAMPSATVEVKVNKEAGEITFKTNYLLRYLKDLKIDLNKNTVYIKDFKLKLIDTIFVADSSNIFRSSWRGYKWQYSSPEDIKMPGSQEELSELSMKLYTVTIGLLDKSNKTYIEVAGTEINNGIQTVKYQVPILFE